jgi:hypothetical protein
VRTTSRQAEAELQAFNLAQVEDSITLIRECKIKSKPNTIGFLVVNKDTTSTPKEEEFVDVHFHAGIDQKFAEAICDILPEEYEEILNKKRKLPKDWKLGDILFDGTFVYKDMTKLVESLKEWPYSIETDDEPENRLIGFKCKSGRKWRISLTNFKKTGSSNHFKSFENKEKFINDMNTKPFYKGAVNV